MEPDGLLHVLKEIAWLAGLIGAAATAASTAAVVYIKAFQFPG
jgi:hypothetical protein